MHSGPGLAVVIHLAGKASVSSFVPILEPNEFLFDVIAPLAKRAIRIVRLIRGHVVRSAIKDKRIFKPEFFFYSPNPLS